jgi:hypothetical protein
MHHLFNFQELCITPYTVLMPKLTKLNSVAVVR